MDLDHWPGLCQGQDVAAIAGSYLVDVVTVVLDFSSKPSSSSKNEKCVSSSSLSSSCSEICTTFSLVSALPVQLTASPSSSEAHEK